MPLELSDDILPKPSTNAEKTIDYDVVHRYAELCPRRNPCLSLSRLFSVFIAYVPCVSLERLVRPFLFRGLFLKRISAVHVFRFDLRSIFRFFPVTVSFAIRPSFHVPVSIAPVIFPPFSLGYACFVRVFAQNMN